MNEIDIDADRLAKCSENKASVACHLDIGQQLGIARKVFELALAETAEAFPTIDFRTTNENMFEDLTRDRK